jgi:hypothetical protein
MDTAAPLQLKACAGDAAEKLLLAVAAEVNIRNKKKITAKPPLPPCSFILSF